MGSLYKTGAKQDLLSLCRVNKLLSREATRWIYRIIELNFAEYDAPYTSRSLSALIHRKPPYQGHVRSLTVTMGSALYDLGLNLPHSDSQHVLTLLPLLKSLESFRYAIYSFIPEVDRGA